MATIDQIRIEMGKTNAVFQTEVFEKRNFDALDDVYTEDARILPPGAPMISGRPAIKEFWTSLVLGANATAASLTSVEVMAAGPEVVEIGNAALTTEGGALEVKYVVYWRQEAGLWKWYVDIWNTNA